MRQLKREVKIGNVTIGGNNPIAVQTIETNDSGNTPGANVAATL